VRIPVADAERQAVRNLVGGLRTYFEGLSGSITASLKFLQDTVGGDLQALRQYESLESEWSRLNNLRYKVGQALDALEHFQKEALAGRISYETGSMVPKAVTDAIHLANIQWAAATVPEAPAAAMAQEARVAFRVRSFRGLLIAAESVKYGLPCLAVLILGGWLAANRS
jgi:hypothetical protein